MNKSRLVFWFRSIGSTVAIFAAFVFVFILASNTNAASTIGTNLSTTGTLEVSNTASAAYLLSGNTLQVGGHASVAYSRFGTSATSHAGYIAGSNDVLVVGDFEVDGSAAFDGHSFFGGSASFSLEIQLNDGRFQPKTDSATAIRFQNAAGDTSVLTIDTTNQWVGIGGTPQTKFEVQGTASASYFLTGNTIQVGGFASVAYNRFGTTATTHDHYIAASNDIFVSGDLEGRGSLSFAGPASFSQAFWVGTNGKTGNVGVGTNSPTTKFHVVGSASVSNNFETIKTASAKSLFATTNVVVGSGGTASSSAIYSLELGTNTTATTSILFGGSGASTKGSCFQFKDSGGTWVYARVRAGATSFTINNQQCHTSGE